MFMCNLVSTGFLPATKHETLSCWTLQKCWVILTQFWVKYGQTQLLD